MRHNTNQRFLARTRIRGAVLVEMMCAIFIITVGVFGALQMYSLALGGAKAVNEYGIAGRALTNEIETLRVLPFERLENGRHPFQSKTPDLKRLVRNSTSVEIADYPGTPDLKSIKTVVRWTGEHGRIIEKQLSTLIARKR